MKFILSVILTVLFAVNSYAQTQGINFSYQGWSTVSGQNNLSLYIAREGFKLGSAFNDENYPIWFAENRPVIVNDGVVNYRITGVSLDSLQKYQGQLFLYVAINGTPHDTIIIDPVPYAGHSIYSENSVESKHSATSDLAVRSRLSDTATYALNAKHAAKSDTATYATNAKHAAKADTATYATNANSSVYADAATYAVEAKHAINADTAAYAVRAKHAINADTAAYARRAGIADSSNRAAHAVNSDISVRALRSDSATVSANAHQVLPGGVNLQAIAAQGAVNGAVLTTNGTTLAWTSPTQIQGRTQLTLVSLQTIDNDVRTLIYRVAQDFATPLPPAVEGRIITIVNSSTANFVSIQAGIWNIWGGDVVISPRNSATMLYHNGQWVVISQ